MKNDISQIVGFYKKIKADYTPSESIFRESDDTAHEIMKVVRGLDIVERTLIILYAELGSYRKMGQVLGVSHASCRRLVLPVIEKIKNIIKKKR